MAATGGGSTSAVPARGMSYVDESGVTMEWDAERGAYFPKIDDDMLSRYQAASYQTIESPEDWVEGFGPDGRPYYFNKKTNVSVWERPAILGRDKWTVHPAPDGRVYYYNEATKQSQWVPPPGFQPPAATAGAAAGAATAAPTVPVGAGGAAATAAPPQPGSNDVTAASTTAAPAPAAAAAAPAAPDAPAPAAGAPARGKGKRKKNEPKKQADDMVHIEGGMVVVRDDANPHVYVTGLPPDITIEEFHDFMRKAGIVAEDDEGAKKIKLYRNENGEVKGDGRCTYLRVESVTLALQLLDETEIKPGFPVHIERAKFKAREEKPAKEAKPGEVEIGAKPKQKKKSAAAKYLHWHETDVKRKRAIGVMVLKHAFTPDEFKKDPTYLFDLKRDMATECEKFGEIKKIEVFDNNPEGVVMVKFATEEALGLAMATLNGRYFAGRKLIAEEWDGKTRYAVKESEEEAEERITGWDQYLNEESAA